MKIRALLQGASCRTAKAAYWLRREGGARRHADASPPHGHSCSVLFGRGLPVSTGGLMTMWVMHRLAMKFCTVFACMLAARGHGSAIPFAKIEVMIDMSVEMFGPVVPRPYPDEYTA
jgi:hypothetical protein